MQNIDKYRLYFAYGDTILHIFRQFVPTFSSIIIIRASIMNVLLIDSALQSTYEPFIRLLFCNAT